MTDTDSLIQMDRPAFVHPSAQLFGKISISEGVSIWPNAVARAEQYEITIGPFSNVQDFVMLHVGDVVGTHVGAHCSITHHATLHGCRIGDNCLIGINATVMDRVEIGDNSIVAGHTIVPEGMQIPANSVVAGVPGKVIKSRNNWLGNRMNAWLYHRNALAFARGEHREWSSPEYVAARQVEFDRLQTEFKNRFAPEPG